jgi:hypothetical protein
MFSRLVFVVLRADSLSLVPLEIVLNIRLSNISCLLLCQFLHLCLFSLLLLLGKLFINRVHLNIRLNLGRCHRFSIPGTNDIVKAQNKFESISLNGLVIYLLSAAFGDDNLLQLFHDLNVFDNIGTFSCDKYQK